MIDSFIFSNQRTKKEIEFGKDNSYDFIVKEVDWGNIKANHNTFTFPSQIGSTISSSKMNERDVMITGYVYSSINLKDAKLLGIEDARKNAYSEMIKNKQLLNELVNPNDIVRIKIGEYFLEGKPDQTISYGIDENDNNEYFCKFFISIFCSNPMFMKESKVESKLGESSPEFHFPLILKSSGIIMSSREEYLIVPVYNEGDNKVGGIITIKSKGEVVNPMLRNIDTNEVIKINKTLYKGEEIKINTNDGEKSIIGISGNSEENYFKYWDFDNVWIKFEEGTSMIGYSSEDGNESLLEVAIEIYPQRFALEEM